MSDEILWVTGGAGGQAALTEDLEHAAGALAWAARLLDDVTTACARHAWVAEGVVQEAAPVLVGTAAEAHEAVVAVAFGPHGSRAVADDLSALGARLAHVSEEFLMAERAARRYVSDAQRLGDAARDLVESTAWLARVAVGIAWRWSLPGIVAHARGQDPGGEWMMPDGPPPTAGLLSLGVVEQATGALDRLPGTPLPWEALGLPSPYEIVVVQLAYATGVLEALLGEPRPRAAVPVVADSFVDPPRGIADLIDGVTRAHGDKDGAVGITEIAHHDGTSAFVVSIPGTEDWGLTSANQNDTHGNLASMAGGTSDAMRVVVDAMDAARIPADAAVMLVGHSQGGIGAMALASSPSFRERFRVTHVVTVGSPVGRFDTGRDVQQLHLQHTGDPVPGLDGRANRDAPHVTTVQHDLARTADGELSALARGTAGAHHLDGYRRTAELVDETPTASTTAFTASAAPFLTGEHARYTEFVPVGDAATRGARPAAVA